MFCMLKNKLIFLLFHFKFVLTLKEFQTLANPPKKFFDPKNKKYSDFLVKTVRILR